MERPTHFEGQLELLSHLLSQLGSLTEEAIDKSVKALVQRDSQLARQVVVGDAAIDELELRIDELCMELLLRQQPMAADFRFLATAMKVTPDLERIADHAANIAERATELNGEPPWPLGEIPEMAAIAREMVHGALAAFMQRDTALARRVIERDDELDRLLHRNFRHLMDLMIQDPQNVSRGMRLSFVTKYLERIGDQATNICEQVVFMAEAEVIRHPGVDQPSNRS